MPHSVSKRKSRKRHLNTHIKTPRTENTGYLAAVKPNRSSRKQLPHLYVWLTEGRLIFTSLCSVLVRWQPTLPSANIPQTWKLYCFAHSLNSVKHLILQIYLYKGNITVFQSVFQSALQSVVTCKWVMEKLFTKCLNFVNTNSWGKNNMRKAKIVVKKKSGKRMWQLQKVQRRRNPGKITITCIN